MGSLSDFQQGRLGPRGQRRSRARPGMRLGEGWGSGQVSQVECRASDGAEQIVFPSGIAILG